MVGDSTNDKLRLLSAFADDEDVSDDEDEIFIGQLTKARTSRNTEDFKSPSSQLAYSDDPHLSLASGHLAQAEGNAKQARTEECDKYQRREHANCYRLSLLMLNFTLNGTSFGLFIYSRDYFMETFKIEETMSNNMILIELFTTLVGVFVANLLSNKLDRFHFLFFCSVLSSLGLLGIVQSHHLTYAVLFIGLYGLCMGFSTAIAIKWCLRLNNTANKYRKQSQNLQTNLLQVLSLVGLLIFFTLFTSSINGSHFEAINNTRSDPNPGQLQLITSTEKVHLKKPSISDGSYLEQDHVTKPTFSTNGSLTSRQKRQMLLTTQQPAEPTTTTQLLVEPMATNLTTTEKVHLKKPETADGSFLEQSHITKPSVEAGSTRSPEMTYSGEYVKNSVQLRECLAKLKRTCHLRLENCRVDLLPAQNQTEESAQAACEYAYSPLEASALSPQNKECADQMASQSNHSQSADDCFSSARVNLDQLLEVNKKQEYKCFILTSSKKRCDATASCKYTSDFNEASAQISQEVTGCFEIEWKKISDSTSTAASTSATSTTTATTASSSTSATTTTASTTTTKTSERTSTSTQTMTTSILVNQSYIAYANDIFKLSNDTERIYLILAMAYMALTVLHCVYFFRLIKDMLFSLWLTIRYLACCLCKSQGNQSASFESNINPLRSLQVPLDKSSKSEFSLGIVTCQEIISSVGFWLIMVMFFLYGGLLLNFLLFMKLYLTSQLGRAQHNHISLIFNMFLVSFMVGRISIILINSLCKCRRHMPSKTPDSKRTSFWIQALPLTSTLGFLAAATTIQLYSSKESLNIESSQNASNLTSVSPFNLQSTTILYGIIFPGLLSTLFPQLFSLFDMFVVEKHRMKKPGNTSTLRINSYISIYMWQIGSLGAVLVTLFNNYATFSIFKSSKVFAYSNCILTVLLLVVSVLFVCEANRKAARKRRFISFNELKFNELKVSQNTEFGTDSENEEIELMVPSNDK